MSDLTPSEAIAAVQPDERREHKRQLCARIFLTLGAKRVCLGRVTFAPNAIVDAPFAVENAKMMGVDVASELRAFVNRLKADRYWTRDDVLRFVGVELGRVNLGDVE